MFIFYNGLTNTSKDFLNKECGGAFMNVPACHAYVLLDGLLSEVKIMKSSEKAEVPEEDFDDRYEIFNLYDRDKKIEEVKMLSEVREPLLDLDKCRLHELIDGIRSIENKKISYRKNETQAKI